MIADKNFRMTKQSKIYLAGFRGTNEDYNQFRKFLVDAELREEAAKKAALKSKEKDFSKD